MPTDHSLVDPILINTIGHTAGVLLFGFIIALFLQDRQAYGVRQSRLSIGAAGLALAWNIGSLIALGNAHADAHFLLIISTASFALLSLLPAVLFQVTLQGRLKTLSILGYGVSAAAIALHFTELFVAGFAPHQVALLLIAFGFAGLSIAALFANRSATLGKREWFSLVCLLLFVLSFPHFGYQHFRSPWAAEIAWHHIGIPVALIVLLQDYRFLLLDTFIRFLMNAALAATYVACIFGLNQRFHLLDQMSASLFIMGVALVAFGLSLILFAGARNSLQNFASRALFHRESLEECTLAITQLGGKTLTEEALIEDSAKAVAAHFHVGRYVVVADPTGMARVDRPAALFGHDAATDISWAEVQTPLRFSSGEVRYLLTGPRRGRQRYLSEDLDDMRRLAAVMVEQVERFRTDELKRLASQAELRALQAQINPHFLFNAFNTLYGTIDPASQEARRMVLNLSDIFRYFLQGDRTVIAFSEELRIIKAYLEIEALRLGDRLTTELEISSAALGVVVPILSVQPLVENAVKHGVANKAGPGKVIVRALVEEGVLRITVEDVSFGAAARKTSPNGSGQGLANVKRRLHLSYGEESTLEIVQGRDGSSVRLVVPVVGSAVPV